MLLNRKNNDFIAFLMYRWFTGTCISIHNNSKRSLFTSKTTETQLGRIQFTCESGPDPLSSISTQFYDLIEVRNLKLFLDGNEVAYCKVLCLCVMHRNGDVKYTDVTKKFPLIFSFLDDKFLVALKLTPLWNEFNEFI
jgi:hypothetical protein